ncbi:MAG TPA: PAS domain S-box protein [Polyangiaceae bacterium]
MSDLADTVARLETELEAARAELRAWEQLANRSRDMISRIDASGRITYVSPSVRKILGYEPSELVGQVAHGFLAAAEQAPRRADFEHALEGAAVGTTVTLARHKDGTHVWMEYRTEVLRDAAGNITGFQSNSHDVTARHQAQEALERSEANFETFVRTMPVPGLVHRDGAVALVNASFRDVFGYADEDVVGKKVVDLIDPADRAYVGGRLEQPREVVAGTATRELHALHKNGTRVPVEVTVVPVLLRGQPATLAVYRDLRERKRLEAQLITADRMVSLGRLAAAVGHEINNPLAYALSSITLLEREMAKLDASSTRSMCELLASVKEGAERIRLVADDLRVFSRERTEAYGAIDLVRLLDRAASMAAHEVRHRARLVQDYRELPAISGSEARLGQVFLNLLVNAAQAIPEGDVASNEVRIEGRATDSGGVAIDVVDTGVGIEPELAQRIFEPFFTTKPAGGTGLGLSISQHIVASLGGTLQLVSSRPRETRFRVVLPVS